LFLLKKFKQETPYRKILELKIEGIEILSLGFKHLRYRRMNTQLGGVQLTKAVLQNHLEILQEQKKLITNTKLKKILNEQIALFTRDVEHEIHYKTIQNQ